MVAKRISEAEFARSMPELLELVRGGDCFEIERDGELYATLVPPETPRGITWGEFVAMYYELPRPDDRFADDLEAVLAERQMLSHLQGGPTEDNLGDDFVHDYHNS